jgi:hypothetical protein
MDSSLDVGINKAYGKGMKISLQNRVHTPLTKGKIHMHLNAFSGPHFSVRPEIFQACT